MRETALRARRPLSAESTTAADAGNRVGRVDAAAPAYRHSRRVALLKRLLPAIGVALLLLTAMWPRLAPLWEGMRLPIRPIDLHDARQLKMIHPRYAGIDRDGRPFVVTAASGRQLPDRRDLMSLQAPQADLQTHNGAAVTLNARTGIYQSQTQLLDLFGDVTVVHQDGTRLVTQSARVDAAHNTAQGDAPVEGHGPSGDIKAQGFRILDKGGRILFTGRAELWLKRGPPVAPKTPPATLPPPVARAAARAQAEAKPLLESAYRKPATRHVATRHDRPRHHVARHRGRRHGTRHRAVHAKAAAHRKS